MEDHKNFLKNEQEEFQKKAFRLIVAIMFTVIAMVWMIIGEPQALQISSHAVLHTILPALVGLYGILFYFMTRTSSMPAILSYATVGSVIVLMLLLFSFIRE